MATIAAILTTQSEIIAGKSGYTIDLSIGPSGSNFQSDVTIGPGVQTSTYLTIAGWIAPIAPLSLLMQSTALASDFGVISPPPINFSSSIIYNQMEYHGNFIFNQYPILNW